MRDDEAARLIIAASNYIRPPARGGGGCHNTPGKINRRDSRAATLKLCRVQAVE